MSYKFQKADWYKSEKRFIELSVHALKICIDPDTKFESPGNHEITYSCTHKVSDEDLIHHITDEIIVSIEYNEDFDSGSVSINSYNLYIYDKNASDKWYLVSYLSNDEVGNAIHIGKGKEIYFNLDENYFSYYDESLPGNQRSTQLSLPFTKDEYFNFSMNIDFEISHEEIMMVLDFEAPDGFNINMFVY